MYLHIHTQWVLQRYALSIFIYTHNGYFRGMPYVSSYTHTMGTTEVCLKYLHIHTQWVLQRYVLSIFILYTNIRYCTGDFSHIFILIEIKYFRGLFWSISIYRNNANFLMLTLLNSTSGYWPIQQLRGNCHNMIEHQCNFSLRVHGKRTC